VNEATLQLYEPKSKTDLLGPLDMTLDSGAIGDFIELFVAIAEGHTRMELEGSAHTLTGKNINLLIRAFIPAESDPYPYMLVTAVDFTDYKRLEKSLREERSVVRAAIDGVADQLFVKDHKGRFILANRPPAAWAGTTSPEELIGKTDYDFFPKDVANNFAAYKQDSMQSRAGKTNFEEEMVSAVGVHAWALTSIVPFGDFSSETSGIVGIVHDITERRNIERRVEKERTLLRTLITNLPDGIFLKDVDGRFVFK
jgi:PAS domain S-box-containing protein